MALTRARAIAGPSGLRARVDEAVRASLVFPRDKAKIAADVIDMRERIAKEKGTDDIWDLKQVRGGLVDVEFIAQYLQLVHARSQPRGARPEHGRRHSASCAMPGCWRMRTPTSSSRRRGCCTT